MSKREVLEGIQYQGEDEEIVYTLTTTNWISSPTSPSVVVKERDGEDVTSTVMPTNSPSVSGDVITLSPLKSLTVGKEYRVEVSFQAGGSKWEAFFRVTGEE